MTWGRWTCRLNGFLGCIDNPLWADLVVITGGIEAGFSVFGAVTGLAAPVVPAGLGNNAGIVGARCTAARGTRGLR